MNILQRISPQLGRNQVDEAGNRHQWQCSVNNFDFDSDELCRYSLSYNGAQENSDHTENKFV
jgi:hypothetical protein